MGVGSLESLDCSFSIGTEQTVLGARVITLHYEKRLQEINTASTIALLNLIRR
jgi:hypothetical protein